MKLIKLLFSIFILWSSILSYNSYALTWDVLKWNNIHQTKTSQDTWHNILINDKIMSLLANNMKENELYGVLWTWTITKLKPYCNIITTWQILKITKEKFKKLTDREQKKKVLFKTIYLYKCVLTRIEKERQMQKLMETKAEEQMLDTISIYLKWWWYAELKKLHLTDRTKQIIRDKINNLINPLNIFDKPNKEISLPYNKLADSFKGIQFIVRKQDENIDWFRTWNILTDTNIDLYDAIKVASIFWPRYLTKSWEYHFGYDLTLLDKKEDVKYNCAYKPTYYYNITKLNYIMHKLFFNKDIACWTGMTKYPNYKKDNNIFTKLNLEKIKKNWGKCYIWKHLSRYSDRLVWFGNFLICKLNKNDNVWTLFWHNDIKFDELIKNNKNLLSAISLNSKEYIKVDGILWSFFQKNYSNFNKKENNFNWPILVNYLTNIWLYRVKLYRINLDKALKKWYNYFLVRYWTTWHSYWKHIHWWILYKNGIYVSPVQEQAVWMSLLKQLFNDKRIWEKNYYYSVYSLTFKWKNQNKQLALNFK